MNTSGQGSEFGERTADAFNREEFELTQKMRKFFEETGMHLNPSLEVALARANEDISETQGDMVNHPRHYTSDLSGIECIRIVRHRNFNVGNAIKYLWRAGIKDDAKQIEDLKKAIFYINDEIKRLGELSNG